MQIQRSDAIECVGVCESVFVRINQRIIEVDTKMHEEKKKGDIIMLCTRTHTLIHVGFSLSLTLDFFLPMYRNLVTTMNIFSDVFVFHVSKRDALIQRSLAHNYTHHILENRSFF